MYMSPNALWPIMKKPHIPKHGLLGGFNKPLRQIDFGLEKQQMAGQQMLQYVLMV